MKKNIFKTLAVTVLSAVSLTAWAVDPYAGLVNTTTEITFDGKLWYLIDYDASTVTLLAKECVAASQYNPDYSSGNTYSGSTVETTVNNYYTNSISDTEKSAVVGGGMFLLTKEQANAMTSDTRKCSKYSGTDVNAWWLCSAGNTNFQVWSMYSEYAYATINPVNTTLGVRPALKLDLSKVTFDTETKTFSVAPTTSVATPTLSPADAAKSNIWYDLNGRHYKGKPTMPGVYINNRQKYVVK